MLLSYMVTHLMGADLNNIVKTQRLSDDHVQFLAYQILRGLKVTNTSHTRGTETVVWMVLDHHSGCLHEGRRWVRQNVGQGEKSSLCADVRKGEMG